MKQESRVIGFIEVPFTKNVDKTTKIVGAITRGGFDLDGLLVDEVTIDGDDVTDVIIRMILKSKFKRQLKVIFLQGISVGGFNVADIHRINKECKLPVIVIIRKKPEGNRIQETLTEIGMGDKIDLINKAGEIYTFGETHYQVVGLPHERVREVLALTRTNSEIIPEPLRLAKIIASGYGLGESR